MRPNASEWNADNAGVARIVVVADCQGEVPERRQWIAVLGFESTEDVRQVGFVVTVTAVVGDHEAPPQSIACALGITVAPGDAIREERE